MTSAHWKAAFIAAAIEQEWLPGIDGKPVPYRPSSENFSRKKYCDLIAVAQAFGDEHGVEWSERATAQASEAPMYVPPAALPDRAPIDADFVEVASG